MRTFPRPPSHEVFAVGTETAQVLWRQIDEGPLHIELFADAEPGAVGNTAATSSSAERQWTMKVLHPGGPGSVDLDGLSAARTYRVVLSSAGSRAAKPVSLHFTTLAPPPGEHLCRLATVNDVHLGSQHFGIGGALKERQSHPDGPASQRCAQAAFDAIDRWNANHLIIKGDFVDKNQPEFWDLGMDMVRRLGVPWDLVLGNHETRDSGIPHQLLESFGYPIVDSVRVRDVPGVRLILGDTAQPLTNRGNVAGIAPDILDAAAETDGPVIVWLHHQLQPRKRAWMLPAGISGTEAIPLLDALDRVKPGALVVSGHTHRHRRWSHRSITVVETGSTKDYPGTWAGYDIHEGGVRQIVRRVATPDCLAWTNRTTRAALGAWGRWSPGHLDERCFTLAW